MTPMSASMANPPPPHRLALFQAAARANDLLAIQAFLADFPGHVDAVVENSMDLHRPTALLLALEARAFDAARALLEAGANVFARIAENAQIDTPAIVAAERREGAEGAAFFHALLDRTLPEEIIRREREGNHPFFINVAIHGDAESLRRVIAAFLSEGPPDSFLSALFVSGLTQAAGRSDQQAVECVKALLPVALAELAGASRAQALNAMGILCAKYGAGGSFVALVAAAPDSPAWRAANADGDTALTCAAIRWDADAVDRVRLLLPLSDANAQDGIGRTALMAVANMSTITGRGTREEAIGRQIARMLIPATDLSLRDIDGKDALDLAFSMTPCSVVDELVAVAPERRLLKRLALSGSGDLLANALTLRWWEAADILASRYSIERAQSALERAVATGADLPRARSALEAQALAATVAQTQTPEEPRPEASATSDASGLASARAPARRV